MQDGANEQPTSKSSYNSSNIMYSIDSSFAFINENNDGMKKELTKKQIEFINKTKDSAIELGISTDKSLELVNSIEFKKLLNYYFNYEK